MESLLTRIIILDDDCLHTSLAMLAFQRMLHDIRFDMQGFTDPREGLRYLETEFACYPVHTLLLLDISMPYLDGWDVLHRLEKLPPHISQCLSVFIVSSSISKHDVERSEESPLVKAYLAKPLTDHLDYLLAYIMDNEKGNTSRVTIPLPKGKK